MSAIRKVTPLQVEDLADNRTRVIASTNALARDGHVVEPSGIDTSHFLRGGTILFDHDPQIPVARPVSAQLSPDGSSLSVEVEWPPAGTSDDADKVRRLVKAGIIRSVSIGFEATDMEPLDPKKPKGGQRIRASELLELSFVAVPADTGAVVTQRSTDDWKCGASRDLPIADSDEWDGSAAESSIFTWAGGDDFDPAKARKGFLAYNAAKPKERGSYKLPIAHVVGGRLTVPKGAIRAAASRLPQTDIPDSTKKAAEAVLSHYKEKAGMSSDRSARVPHLRKVWRKDPATFQRDLYKAAWIARILEDLGCLHGAVEYEEDREQDTESTAPEQLGEAVKALAEMFVDYAKEEADELLAMLNGIDDDDELDDGERSHIKRARTPLGRAWRLAQVRAGKALSKANEAHLERGMKHHARATKNHAEQAEDHEQVAEHLDGAKEAHGKAVEALDNARTAHGELGEALQAVKHEPEKATEHVARAIKLHKQVDGHHEDAQDAHEDIATAHQQAEEAHGDAEDVHESIGRHLAGIGRCMRAVIDGSNAAAKETDGDSRLVQTSSGTDESTGSAGDRGRRPRTRRRDRRADMKRLAAVGSTY